VVIHRGLAAWLAVAGALTAAPDAPAAGGPAAGTRRETGVPELVRAVTNLALGAVRG